MQSPPWESERKRADSFDGHDPVELGEAFPPCGLEEVPHERLSRHKAVRGAAVQAPEDGQVIAARARSARVRLIHKVYEVDPLQCPECGAPMHVIALIDDAAVIRRILEHLGRWASREMRRNQHAPPGDAKGIDGLEPPERELTYHPVPDIA